MTASKLNDSIDTVVERVKELQAEKKPRNELLIELNRLIHDPELFSVKQRAIVVREVNKAFKLNVTMSEIKRAIKTVNTAKPEKAMPIDGLSGTTTLNLESKPDPESASEAVAPEPAPVESAPAPAPKVNRKPRGETFSLRGNDTPTTSSSTQEDINMAPLKETLETVSNRIATGAPLTHEQKVEAMNILLASVGATTEEARIELINGFIAANPSKAITWNLMKNYPQGEHGITGLLVAYLEIDESNRSALDAYLAPVVATEKPAPVVAPVADPSVIQPAPAVAKPEASVAVEITAPGLKERVMTTIRGNRETGFSSGVVAATTAVVGGGLEMAFKGSVTAGSAIGTAVGATGAYFLGDATEKMMESETGRYLLAGAIGVVAGGLGSRVGRGVQDEYVNPSVEIAGAVETVPGTPAVPAGPLVGNSEALLGMFGM